MKKVLLLVSVSLLGGCTSTSRLSQLNQSSVGNSVPFQYAGGHLIKIPVRINDAIDTHFILDTGIGVSLISKSLCERLKCKVTKNMKGERMSGQSLNIPLTSISALSVAGYRQESAEMGIWEMNGFLPKTADCKDVEGFISLNFFAKTPFTMDYKKGILIIESEASLFKRKQTGVVVPIKLERDQEALTIFMSLQIPGGPPISAEVDLGGNILTLNEKYMKQLKVKPSSASVIREDSKDETNHPYVRYFTKISGPIFPVEAESLSQADLDVMFQKIIHDGLVGNSFLKRFTVTYDLANAQMIFQTPDK